MGVTIEENALYFKSKASEFVGNYENRIFDIDLTRNINELNIKSPIEQFLYIAIRTVMKANSIQSDEPREQADGNIFIDGVEIKPQYKINNYRVDFMISFSRVNLKKKGEQITRSIIVECDSQQFYDRTEPERRYEKKRDRYIQKLNYKVFKFTGSEIIKNPYDIASEILGYVCNLSQKKLLNKQQSIMEKNNGKTKKTNS